MESRSIRIAYLKAIIKATNQAYGNINCDADLKLDRKDKKLIEKELIKDEGIITLTKKYMENNHGRRN